MEPYTIPEDLTGIEDIAQAQADARAAADAITAIEDPSDADVEALEALADHLEALDAEAARRDGEVQARADRRAAAVARLDATAEEEEPEEPGENVSLGENEAEAEEADEAPAPIDAEADEAPAEVAEEPQAVAASGPPQRRSTIPRTRKPENPMPARSTSPATIVAAAGIPNVEPGGNLPDSTALAAAFSRKTASFPQVKTPPQNLYNRVSVATLHRNDFGGFTDRNPDYDTHQDLLDAAANPTRVQAGLVAAGGWCAPSQTLYDLVEVESTDGLLDLPEVNVTRGGLRFTEGPDFASIYSAVGFSQTEAQAIAGTTKTSYEVTCPTFEEVRLDAKGILVKSPILTEAAYPELVARVLRGSLVAHQHKVSVSLLASMQTEIGAAVVAPATGSVTHSVLTSLELAAEGERNRRRLPQNMLMEAVLPHWLLVAMRSDLSNRAGMDPSVTDAYLNDLFVQRHLRVQFLYGYSDARIITPNCLVDFPDTAEGMVYAAGTFVKGVADIISLDTVYDTTDLQSNVYTAAFVEEGVLLAKRAPGGCRITIPVAVTGRTGAHDVTASYGVTDA